MCLLCKRICSQIIYKEQRVYVNMCRTFKVSSNVALVYCRSHFKNIMFEMESCE